MVRVVTGNAALVPTDMTVVDRSPEELAPALAAIDAGELHSILTTSAGLAQLALRRGYRVTEVHAGTETLYEIRAAGGGIDGIGVEPAGA